MGAFLSVLCPTIVVSRLPFCHKEINHFFCNIAPLLQAACIDTHFTEMINFLLSSLILLTSLVLTTVSYTYIISTILHIPSAQGRQKAFSTCASHITVVSIAYGSNIFMYVRPSQSHSLEFDKVTAVLTTMMIPLLNPFIYSLRNERVKEVLTDAVNKIISLLPRKLET